MALALLGLELGGIYPGVVEDAFIDGLVLSLVQDVGAEVTGFIQGTGHRAGHVDLVNSLLSFALEGPLGEGTGQGGNTRHHHK